MTRMHDTLSIHQELVQNGLCAPVEPGGAEERLWCDCDLASMAESRIGDTTDPRDVDEARRADWLARATTEVPWSLRSRSKYERCYWLLDVSSRKNTCAPSARRCRPSCGADSHRTGTDPPPAPPPLLTFGGAKRRGRKRPRNKQLRSLEHRPRRALHRAPDQSLCALTCRILFVVQPPSRS